MEFAKNGLIYLSRSDAQNFLQAFVLAVRPVLPSHRLSAKQPFNTLLSVAGRVLRRTQRHMIPVIQHALCQYSPCSSRHFVRQGNEHNIGGPP